ncbi:hypothetical protein [Actinoplanes sp. NPDC051851]|uniref:hypothetical protein n=1 Tax=Actinoplanes sp. NPDC051851 TaxID=3154753 RepID=UPI00341394CD
MPPTAASGIVTPVCSWGWRVSAVDVNAYYPDTAAVYWSMWYQYSDDLSFDIQGRFPDARYMSFNVYDLYPSSFSSNGVESSLSDYEITPDEGSVNPWQTDADPGGTYTLHLKMNPDPGEVNTLPLAPEGTVAGSKGSVIFRVYLATDLANVVLPTVTAYHGDTGTVLNTCQTAGEGNAKITTDSATLTESLLRWRDRRRRDIDPTTGLAFARTSELSQKAPNNDNAYLITWVDPPAADADDVIMIRAKAPRAVSGTRPRAWPVFGADVRYWSFCTNLLEPNNPVVANVLEDGSIDYGCRYDADTAIDRDGYYTYVLGTESQRAAIESIHGATFLPFSTDQSTASHMVIMRTLLPTDEFRFATQRVAMDSSPEAAAAVMGDYYPRVSTCSLTRLTQRGLPACFHH